MVKATNTPIKNKKPFSKIIKIILFLITLFLLLFLQIRDIPIGGMTKGGALWDGYYILSLIDHNNSSKLSFNFIFLLFFVLLFISLSFFFILKYFIKTGKKIIVIPLFLSFIILIITTIFFITIFDGAKIAFRFAFLPSDIEQIGPIPTPTPYQYGKYTVFTRDDKQNKKFDLVVKNNDEEIIVTTIDKTETTPFEIFSGFLISSDNKYLHYIDMNDNSWIFNLENKDDDLVLISALSKGFTKDNNYFYGCSGESARHQGVFIHHLPDMNIVYKNIVETTKCEYDQKSNTLNIEYIDIISGVNKTIIYSFDSNRIISQ